MKLRTRKNALEPLLTVLDHKTGNPANLQKLQNIQTRQTETVLSVTADLATNVFVFYLIVFDIELDEPGEVEVSIESVLFFPFDGVSNKGTEEGSSFNFWQQLCFCKPTN